MAMTHNDKVLEALASLVPEDKREKAATLVASLLDEAVADLKEQLTVEYNEKLEEGYHTITEEREKDWQTAEDGYKQAYDIITDLRARLGRQEEEFQQTLEEEYESAYQMILTERQKNDNISATLYEEFDKRLQDMKEYMVDQLDVFLGEQGEEYYEMARREVLNDPCLLDHRLAFERVLDVTKDYLSDEDIMLNTNARVDELERKVESVQVAKRQLESKNMRLMTENTKMQDYLKETKELIEKNILNEQNARLESARNVEGRGQTVVEPERNVFLGEAVDGTVTDDTKTVDDEPKTITEQWQVLAGLKEGN